MGVSIVSLPPAAASAVPSAASAVPTTFTAGPDFERKVLGLLLRDDRFAKEAPQFLRPSHFTSAVDVNISGISIEFSGKYGIAPDIKTLFTLICADHRISAAERPIYVTRLSDVYANLDLRERDFIRDNVVKFCQVQELMRVAAEIPGMLTSPKGPEISRVKEMLTKAATIGDVQAASFYEYFAEAKHREEERDAKARGVVKRGVSTGCDELDNLLYHRGWGRGELSVPMAPAKRGKTAFALQSSILSCVTKGMNWLFISCEVGLEIIGDRLDACLSNTSMGDLITNRSHVSSLVSGMAAGPGKFYIERYPSATLTTDGIDALIQYYIDSGRPLDGVVVDYIGILRLKTPDDRFVGLGIAAKELRRIAGKYDIAMIAPAQTNRDAVGKQTSGMDSIGESFAIVQDCDILLSINATDQEMAHGVRRIAVAAGRNQADFTIKVQGDLDKMRLIENVLEVTR